MPTRPMSEQCTAPHILMQQAREMRTGAGRRMLWKSSNTASITHFTGPEASVAGVWQCTHPWVCTMLLTPAPVPPTGNLKEPPGNLRELRSSFSAFMAASSSTMNSILLRVVQRRCPPQCLSAISHSSRICVTDMVRVPPTRTVYTLSPLSATCSSTPGSRISWYSHLPKFLAMKDGKPSSYLRGPMSVIRPSIGFAGLYPEEIKAMLYSPFG